MANTEKELLKPLLLVQQEVSLWWHSPLSLGYKATLKRLNIGWILVFF